MTTIDPMAASYQPPPPRSARTITWAIGRGVVWLVYAFVIFAIVIATLAFFLQLFGANPTADFAAWVYRGAARLTAPFRGIFPAQEGENGSVLDLSLVFAMLMYGLLALLLHALISWLNSKLYLLSAEGEWDEDRAAQQQSGGAPEPPV